MKPFTLRSKASSYTIQSAAHHDTLPDTRKTAFGAPRRILTLEHQFTLSQALYGHYSVFKRSKLKLLLYTFLSTFIRFTKNQPRVPTRRQVTMPPTHLHKLERLQFEVVLDVNQAQEA